MGSFDKNRFASNNQEYETPDSLFKILDEEFHFTLDVCADKTNYKVSNYYTKEQDALTKEWAGICWMNPPYKHMRRWVIKAYNESVKNNAVVVCLIPARTNNVWWHDYCMRGEIRFIKGRPKFKGCKYGLPQPLAVVVFGEKYSNPYKSVVLKEKFSE